MIMCNKKFWNSNFEILLTKDNFLKYDLKVLIIVILFYVVDAPIL